MGPCARSAHSTGRTRTGRRAAPPRQLGHRRGRAAATGWSGRRTVRRRAALRVDVAVRGDDRQVADGGGSGVTRRDDRGGAAACGLLRHKHTLDVAYSHARVRGSGTRTASHDVTRQRRIGLHAPLACSTDSGRSVLPRSRHRLVNGLATEDIRGAGAEDLPTRSPNGRMRTLLRWRWHRRRARPVDTTPRLRRPPPWALSSGVLIRTPGRR
jgi:hypothetical protein